MALTIAQISEMIESADVREIQALSRALADDKRKGVHALLERAQKRAAAHEAELARVQALYDFDRNACGENESAVLVGLDEVGRGSVAGPLAVGAVVLPARPVIEFLDDSKKLSPARRSELSALIKKTASAWAVEYVEPAFIDAHGMTASLKEAFEGALNRVESQIGTIDVVLIDGNPLGIDPRERNVVKGDAKSASIAAASVLAKAERDGLMCELSKRYPDYGFEVHKGYASPQHIEAIKVHGLSDQHRASFCSSFLQETLF